jgi:hypothetical protein
MTLPGPYPSSFPELLAVPPDRRPFVLVADADELLREIGYRARRNNTPLLLSLSERGWSRIFATDRVRTEVERNLPSYAGPNMAAAMRVWQDEYEPAIRWVDLPDRRETGFRSDEGELADRMAPTLAVHGTDGPTAELALMCAPCFLQTGNFKHFAGLAHPKTRDALVAAGHAAEFEAGGRATLSLVELGVRGVGAATAQVVRAAAESPVLAGVLLATLYLAARKSAKGRERLVEIAGRVVAVTGQAAETLAGRRSELLAQIIPALVRPLQGQTVETQLAGILARNAAPITAEAVGLAVVPPLPRAVALAALRGSSAFEFWSGRGWTLGRHFASE